jgi:hypothetical protein
MKTGLSLTGGNNNATAPRKQDKRSRQLMGIEGSARNQTNVTGAGFGLPRELTRDNKAGANKFSSAETRFFRKFIKGQ